MDRDIVLKLREECIYINCSYPGFPEDQSGCPFCEAADEIDRLRVALENSRRLGEDLAKFVSSSVACACRRKWVCHKCQAVNDWKEAFNG